MNSVGVRELKAHLSRHLRRVRAGARLLVTERGRPIATIDPVDSDGATQGARALVATGQAHWDGGKPEGCRPPVALAGGGTVSSAVLEDRR